MPTGSNQPARKSKHRHEEQDGLSVQELLWTAVFRQAMGDRWARQRYLNTRGWWIAGWWMEIADLLGLDRATVRKELVAGYVLPAGWMLPEKPGDGVEPVATAGAGDEQERAA